MSPRSTGAAEVSHYERDAAGRVVKGRGRTAVSGCIDMIAGDRPVAIDAGDVKLVYRYDAAGRMAAAAVQSESDARHPLPLRQQVAA
ncbi:hypothetical protein ACU4HD_44030 [Cupriavidus basilensis]